MNLIPSSSHIGYLHLNSICSFPAASQTSPGTFIICWHVCQAILSDHLHKTLAVPSRIKYLRMVELIEPENIHPLTSPGLVLPVPFCRCVVSVLRQVASNSFCVNDKVLAS